MRRSLRSRQQFNVELEQIMKTPILAAIVIAFASSLALAETNSNDQSLSGKAMDDLPGNNSAGSTAAPTTKPGETSLSGKAMRDQPGNNSAGTTDMPTAKPNETSLSGKAMRDQPGNN
jgi:hypothetical protein